MAFDAKMKWASWHVRRAWDAVGLLDLMGLAMLGVWVGLSFTVNLPLRREVEALRHVVPAASGAADALPKAAPTDRIDAFLRFLPPADLRDQQLRSFHALAREGGVKVVAIDYIPSDLEHLPARRLMLRVSAAADVANQRRFVHDLLASFPNMAIDRLSLQADAVQPSRLEVKLESSFYYRHVRAADEITP